MLIRFFLVIMALYATLQAAHRHDGYRMQLRDSRKALMLHALRKTPELADRFSADYVPGSTHLVITGLTSEDHAIVEEQYERVKQVLIGLTNWVNVMLEDDTPRPPSKISCNTTLLVTACQQLSERFKLLVDHANNELVFAMATITGLCLADLLQLLYNHNPDEHARLTTLMTKSRFQLYQAKELPTSVLQWSQVVDTIYAVLMYSSRGEEYPEEIWLAEDPLLEALDPEPIVPERATFASDADATALTAYGDTILALLTSIDTKTDSGMQRRHARIILCTLLSLYDATLDPSMRDTQPKQLQVWFERNMEQLTLQCHRAFPLHDSDGRRAAILDGLLQLIRIHRRVFAAWQSLTYYHERR